MSRLTVKAIGVETSWCKKNVHGAHDTCETKKQ